MLKMAAKLYHYYYYIDKSIYRICLNCRIMWWDRLSSGTTINVCINRSANLWPVNT